MSGTTLLRGCCSGGGGGRPLPSAAGSHPADGGDVTSAGHGAQGSDAGPSLVRATGAVLAGRLGCSLETLEHLCLCLAPRSETFVDDVAELAERYGVDGENLGRLLKQRERQ